jgi:hypothetical protein
VENAIDFVITWVDGNDPNWIAQRNAYSNSEGDGTDVRFRDWGLLRYWFRSVEKNAPWVRKIHFVTWGHVPEWLDTENPKLHIVKHSDFIPAQYLPTFNSHTIELNLHRIEGLAEQFVYFNDDVFLIRKTPAEFFFRKGLPCDCFALECIYFSSRSIGWISGSNIAVINDHFILGDVLRKNWRKVFSPHNGVRKVIKTLILAKLCPWFPSLYHWHVSFSYLKSTFEEVWAQAGEQLDETCRCRFRAKTNVGPSVFKFWQLVEGRFQPQSGREGHCYHLTNTRLHRVCRTIENHSFNIICANDTNQLSDLNSSIAQIQSSFKIVLPDFCSFEKEYRLSADNQR